MAKALRSYTQKIGEGLHTILNMNEPLKPFLNIYKDQLQKKDVLDLYGFRLKMLNEHLPSAVEMNINGTNVKYVKGENTGYITIEDDKTKFWLNEYKDVVMLLRTKLFKEPTIYGARITLDKNLREYTS